ncbi:pyridoxamine 5'-phosphate oxidase family protein [Acuticoccus sp. M5D2P5]|uniref:pyridoxamine 5'-phosphate oxidase family protein n=1 Tax=Acuticoccus kalidii TaxID=2910977 RepID=UPI001F21E23C|nr:pyridoxamine 5'-phosphate oxidase family protein [Acuticoccus kalidii]MCF3936597.1 pyridoxamine 5'-phosphate oxidase family protein [Acuticoccus kalidii]
MGTPFDPEIVLSRPLMANIATVAADGAPRNAPVWFIWEDGALWIPGNRNGSTVTRLLRDPRCAVEIVDYENAAGVLLHLGLRGRATVEAMDGARFRRLLANYLGAEETWNAWFVGEIAAIDDPDGRLVRLAPESVFTNNVSFFRTGPALAWPPRAP